VFTQAFNSQADDQERKYVCDPFNSKTKKQEINLTLMLGQKKDMSICKTPYRHRGGNNPPLEHNIISMSQTGGKDIKR
jgi:hypothetical protein